MTRLYLGIDPATITGWAVLDEKGNRQASGVWKLGKSTDRLGQRYLAMNRGLEDIVRLYATVIRPIPFDCIGYEEVIRHQSASAAHLYGGFVAMITAWAESYAIPYEGVHYAHAKQAATGKGDASKLAMVQAANRRWPDVAIEIVSAMKLEKGQLHETEVFTFPGGRDNEADSLWIAEATRQRMEQQR